MTTQIMEQTAEGPQPANLLAMMKAAPIWLLWKAVPRPGKPKPDKVPFYVTGTPRQGPLDAPQDRAQLVAYEEAKAAFEKARGAYEGLAIALGPDGHGGHWQGIDLDDIEAQGLSDLANAWVRGERAGMAYIELSPSGTGVHIIGYGRPFDPLGSNHSGIEAYSGVRFFTFTGLAAPNDSPCRPVCLADHVEQVLALRHGKGRSASPGVSGVEEVPIDAKTVTELRAALAHMRADDRDLWVRMGMALKELGQTGRGLWLDWSQTSEKYDPKDAARKWDGFTPRDTSYQAVFAEAQRQGWLNPASNAAQSAPKAGPSAPAARKLVGRSLGGVQMRSIDWLWVGWVPKGYITIFAGETGAGKSTVLADITARVTTGAPWPGEVAAASRQPGRVLWLGSEDSIEEMTAPRLTACGANLENVVEIQGVTQQGKRSSFSMQDDLESISEWLAFAEADGRPFAMLVIDPVTSYLPGQKLRKVDLNDAGQLRSILEPWLALAQKHNLAIVCVTHFAKDTARSMLHRVLGSAAFAQTCRSLCAVIERPAPKDTEPDPHAKALVQVKVNLPEHPGGSWKFRTEKVELGVDPRNNRTIAATRPNWEELDSGLTPQSMVGGSRGPVSKFEATFGMWVQAYFLTQPPGQWLPVETVKALAIAERATTDRWWTQHSGDYLEKTNEGGIWFCRPRCSPHKTT